MTAVNKAEASTTSVRTRLRGLPTSVWVLVAFMALFLVGGAIRPTLFTVEGLVSTATFAAILAIASFGQTIAVVQGGIDLSVPNTIAFSALAFLTWTSTLGPVGAFVAAILSGMAIGLINGLVIARIGLTPIVTTIAMNGLLFGLVLLNFSLAELTVVPEFVTAITAAKMSIGGVQVAAVLPLAVALMIVVQLILSYTGWGRSLYLVGASEETARLAGQPVARIRVGGYMASGALAAFAGIVIVGFYNQAEAMMGAPYLLGSVAAVVVGGASIFGGSGSVAGTFAGALVLGQVATLVAVFNLGTAIQDIVYGAIILVVVAVYGHARQA